MISDVPLGAFLSGGIDSSLLVSMMAQKVSHKVRTFSVGFESEGAHIDETDEAERTARFIGTNHSRVVVTGAELRDNIRHIAWSLDQPSVDGVNSYFVAREARRSVTVAISGNGGDELFAGYPSFIFMEKDQRRRQFHPFEAAARALVASVANRPSLDQLIPGIAGRFIAKARIAAGFVNRYGHVSAVFKPRVVSRLMAPELRHQAHVGNSFDAELGALDELRDGTTIQRVSAICLRGYNNNQLLRDTDAVSMAHSLEVRVPFLDSVVCDVALSLPDSAKLGGSLANLPEHYTYRDSGAKKVLFDIGKPLLPPDFDLQQKRGFDMPFAAWLRGPLHEIMMDALSERPVKERGLLDPAEVAKVRDQVGQGTTNWTRPWLLLMLELWCREVLDRQVDVLRAPERAQGANPGAAIVACRA
jgi:asparagine synthase (glutamine-hydrolysing)